MNLHQAKCYFWIACSISTSVYSLRTISLLFFGVTVWHLSRTNSILVSSCFLSSTFSLVLQPFYTMLFCWTTLCMVFFCTVVCSSFLYSIIPLWLPFLAYIFFEIYQPISNIIVKSYFKLFYTIFVLTNEFAIWVDIQLKCNNIVYFKIYHLQFVAIDGLINDQSSIHMLTQILLEISNTRNEPHQNQAFSTGKWSRLAGQKRIKKC